MTDTEKQNAIYDYIYGELLSPVEIRKIFCHFKQVAKDYRITGYEMKYCIIPMMIVYNDDCGDKHIRDILNK